jgi:predicted transcriptional regulator
MTVGRRGGCHAGSRPSPDDKGSMKGPASGYTGGYTSSMSKIMVSLPDDLLERIDEEARRRSVSRSALLAAAVRRELARRDPDAVAKAIARSEARFRELGAFEASDLVRITRDGAR